MINHCKFCSKRWLARRIIPFGLITREQNFPDWLSMLDVCYWSKTAFELIFEKPFSGKIITGSTDQWLIVVCVSITNFWHSFRFPWPQSANAFRSAYVGTYSNLHRQVEELITFFNFFKFKLYLHIESRTYGLLNEWFLVIKLRKESFCECIEILVEKKLKQCFFPVHWHDNSIHFSCVLSWKTFIFNTFGGLLFLQ